MGKSGVDAKKIAHTGEPRVDHTTQLPCRLFGTQPRSCVPTHSHRLPYKFRPSGDKTPLGQVDKSQ